MAALLAAMEFHGCAVRPFLKDHRTAAPRPAHPHNPHATRRRTSAATPTTSNTTLAGSGTTAIASISTV